MVDQEEAGRRWVLGVIGVSLAWPVFASAAFNAGLGSRGIAQNAVSLLITAALCVFLYRGANWARWVIGGLAALGGLGALLMGFWDLAVGQGGLYFVTAGIVDASIAIVLFLVPAVRLHFGVGRAGSTG